MSISTLMPFYKSFGIQFSRGKGVSLFDESGKEYIDFYSGIGVNSLGHCHDDILDVLKVQGERLWHVSNLFPSKRIYELADLLVQNSFADTVFFTNSGTESVECAIKIAKSYRCGSGKSKKHKFISFKNAFHGRSIVAASASDPKKYLDILGESVPWFTNVEINRDSVLSAITDETAGIIIEPIQGEGGINVIPSDFLKFLREVCDKHDLALIYDCIQCGMGRTGKLFDYEHSGVSPDICTSAKGIASGFPVGACLATEKFAQFARVGMHGSTYGGNPLAMSIALAVVQCILSEGFLDRVCAIGNYLKSKLEDTVRKFPDRLSGVRGRGLMLGLEFTGKEVSIFDLCVKISKHGLLLVPSAHNVVRVMPPLIICENMIDRGIAILERVLSSDSVN